MSDLFTPSTARARNTDPATSHEAAAQVERSGSAEVDRVRALQAVHQWPGSTSAELADRIGMDRHAIARRLPELREAGKVENGDKRACCIKGTAQMTWWAMGRKPVPVLQHLARLYRSLERTRADHPEAAYAMRASLLTAIESVKDSRPLAHELCDIYLDSHDAPASDAVWDDVLERVKRIGTREKARAAA